MAGAETHCEQLLNNRAQQIIDLLIYVVACCCALRRTGLLPCSTVCTSPAAANHCLLKRWPLLVVCCVEAEQTWVEALCLQQL